MPGTCDARTQGASEGNGPAYGVGW